MRYLLLLLLLTSSPAILADRARFEQTPYAEPKVLFEFYFDTPEKISSALFWIRSFMNPLSEPPYKLAPEMMNIKVIIHGTEIVTLVKHNYRKYKETVDRMRYYQQLGVEFRVCGLAAHDYGYRLDDFQDFVIVTPSAMVELDHWQNQGYALIKPEVLPRTKSIDEIR